MNLWSCWGLEGCTASHPLPLCHWQLLCKPSQSYINDNWYQVFCRKLGVSLQVGPGSQSPLDILLEPTSADDQVDSTWTVSYLYIFNHIYTILYDSICVIHCNMIQSSLVYLYLQKLKSLAALEPANRNVGPLMHQATVRAHRSVPSVKLRW